MKSAVFAHVSLIIAAAWMIVIWPAMILFYPQWLPYEMKPSRNHADFPQYYTGAVVAKENLWSALYPAPKVSVYQVPSTFQPLFKTPLYRAPSPTSRDPIYYHDIKLGANSSDVDPRLVSIFPQSQNSLRYIYPPPLAVLLRPLAAFSFETASFSIWPVISVWSLFIGLYFSILTMRILSGTNPLLEGFLVVAWLLFTCRGRMHIYDGNVSPILTALVCISVHGLAKGKPGAFALAFFPLVLFKSLGLSWLGVLFLDRSYWRYLAFIIAITVALNAYVLWVAGTQVYLTFFALLPKIEIPGGVGIQSTMLLWFGVYPKAFYMLVNIACIGLLYYGFWRTAMRGMHRREASTYPLHLVALLAGTMATYCLFNFNIWLPYCPCYLFYPFLGWMLLEGHISTGGWRRFIVASTLLSVTVLSSEWMVRFCLTHFGGAQAARFYEHLVFPPFCIFLIPAFFLIVAFRRIFSVTLG